MPGPVNQPLQEVSAALDLQPKNALTHGWFTLFAYRPRVYFSMAHRSTCLYLKYYVWEQNLLARFQNSNDPVYKDSCAEFFISFDHSGYYNLEINCLGTCLLAFGTGKTDRVMLDKGLIGKINRYISIRRDTSLPESAVFNWELTLEIPVATFCYHHLTTLNNRQARGNFYKCGDDTQQPHFLSWNQINTPAPDFHQPAFFGELHFV